MADDIANPTASGVAGIDAYLLQAATSGDARKMKELVGDDPAVLLRTTPTGNTYLHISSFHGNQRFCEDVLMAYPSHVIAILTAVNDDGETPLLVATRSGHITLASYFLGWCRHYQLSDAIRQQDKLKCNALHHAISSGHQKFALELIEAENALSFAVNEYNESPMFLAVMRDYEDVFERLLGIPGSVHVGTAGYNILHAAVRNGNSAIAKSIMKERPELAREEESHKYTPMHLAVLWNKIDVLRVLLKHDHSLGYVRSSVGVTLLNTAAFRGHVDVAQEILKHCPDTPYRNANDKAWTCLHTAVLNGQMEFVKFVLGSQQLRKLINTRDGHGRTALFHTVMKCNPRILATLLLHQDIDVTVLTKAGIPATWKLSDAISSAKSLNWNEVSMLMLKADPERKVHIYNLHKEIKDKIIENSRKDVKSLTETYTRNTSVVAILMASITFAAAFTVCGWYRSDIISQDIAITAKKIAFQAFLISDTLAVCSSLCVAFICIIARWEDFEFLLHYRCTTQRLMWFAYIATTMAFATGLYTILAPRLLWLAIAIIALSVTLPIATILLGSWPVIKLRIRLRGTFKSDLLSLV